MEPTNEIRHIEVGNDSIRYLDVTRKWTMFLSVLGFIGIGMLVLGIVVMAVLIPVLGNESGLGGAEIALIVGIMLLFGVLYFFPVLYLFRFSVHSKNAVNNLDPGQLTLALKNLKSCFLYIGIFTIVIISLYLIIFLVAGASMAFLHAFQG